MIATTMRIGVVMAMSKMDRYGVLIVDKEKMVLLGTWSASLNLPSRPSYQHVTEPVLS